MTGPSISQFLIACAFPQLSARSREQILLYLRTNPKYEVVLEKLMEEGLVGLAYHHLKSLFPEVPPILLESLKTKTLVLAARQEKIMKQMSVLAAKLAQKNWRWAVVKGLSLTLRFYPESYWRFFYDVDLIVHPDDSRELAQFLLQNKFSSEARPSLQKREGDLLDREKFWLYRPLYTQDELILEIHLGFPWLHSTPKSEVDFWNSRGTFTLNNHPLPCLSPEYELALLALHLQQHSYSRLIWLTDIVQLIQSQQIDWLKLEELAEREHIKASLGYTFLVLDHLWPGSIFWAEKHRFSLKKRETLWLRLFFPLEPILNRKNIQDSPAHTPTFLKLLHQHKVRTWLKALKDFFFPPPHWVAHYYGLKPWSFKFFKHYLWRLSRPFSLIIKRLR